MSDSRVSIGQRNLGANEPVFIIAELGVNFETLEAAQILIEAAARAGADAVKVQTYRADTLTTKKAVFDMENTGITSQYDLFRKFELSADTHRALFAYAQERNILLFSTPSHATDVDLLEKLAVPLYKVGSDDLTNLPFLRYVAGTQKPIILSTGMSTLDEVREAVDAVLSAGNDKLVLLHCVSLYPCQPQNVNLRALITLRETFHRPVGFSDHTQGIEACLAATALGACALEKHFTLNKNAPGPDHLLSSDPTELAQLVRAVRNIEKALGDGIKRPQQAEQKQRTNNRKSLVTVGSIRKGEPITPEKIGIKRPGSGIPPKYFEEILGKPAKQDIAEDEVLTWEML